MNTQLWINGTWRDAIGGQRIPIIDPASEEVIAHVADAGIEDGLAALDAAHVAQPVWAATPPRQRAEVLRAAFAAIMAQADRLAELIVRENGKPLSEAKSEIAYAAEFFRWFSEEAVRNAGSIITAPAGGNRILVQHQPIGVALLITPWNFPAAMATRKIAPALAAGCAVVLKPAKQTPLTALAIGAILHDAGVPAGVVNIVPTTQNAELINTLLADARVRKLSFTGSTEVGRLLLAQAAQRIVKCSMELGGNAPFIVFADADMDAAVEGAMVAKMRHNAETCTAANRFYIEAPIAEEFTRRFTAAMAAVRMGPGLTPGVQLGPLVDAASRDKVARLVEGAVGAGAAVTTGGAVPKGRGFFYPPTVLAKVEPGAAILAEEIFGPVAPIVSFGNEGEAIAHANASQHGLVSYLFTRDLQRGLRVAEAIESGMVGLNRGLVSDPAAPFGGVKQSGLGREGGHEGMLDYTETKYIAVSW